MDLRHAKYVVVTNSIPERFRIDIATDTNRLADEKIARYGFERELSILGRYTGLTRQQSISTEDMSKIVAINESQQTHQLKSPVARPQIASSTPTDIEHDFDRQSSLVEEMMKRTHQGRDIIVPELYDCFHRPRSSRARRIQTHASIQLVIRSYEHILVSGYSQSRLIMPPEKASSICWLSLKDVKIDRAFNFIVALGYLDILIELLRLSHLVFWLGYWPVLVPAAQRFNSSRIMLQLTSLTNLFAFWSMHIQIVSLSGRNGLLPVQSTIASTRQWIARTIPSFELPAESITVLLTRMFLRVVNGAESSDHVLTDLTRNGMVAAAIGTFYPSPVIFAYLFISYYSIKRVTGQFTGLQWDALLLEVGVFSIALSTALISRNDIAITVCSWLFRILLFRLMFGSGLVKLQSGDPSWSKDYDAMTYHFHTQPLPNWLSPLVHSLPRKLLIAVTVGTMILELPLPVVALLPIRSIQMVAAVLYLFLQISISGSGNYGFFNFLSAVLGLSLCDDSHIGWLYSQFAILAVPLSVVKHTIIEAAIPYLSPTLVKIISYVYSTLLLVSPHSLSSYSERLQTQESPESVGDNQRQHQQLLLLQRHEQDYTGVLNSFSQFTFVTIILAFAACIAISNLCAIATLFNRRRLLSSSGAGTEKVPQVGWWIPRFCWYIHEAMSALCVGGHYGLFAVMTKHRREIIIEVEVCTRKPPVLSTERADPSLDTSTRVEDNEWHMVEFAFKPSSVDLPPKPVWPPMHMPRFDWRLWFIGLSPYGPGGPRGCPVYTSHSGGGQMKRGGGGGGGGKEEKEGGGKEEKEGGGKEEKEGGGKEEKEGGGIRFPVPSLPNWLWTFLLSILEGNKEVLNLLHPTLNNHWATAMHQPSPQPRSHSNRNSSSSGDIDRDHRADASTDTAVAPHSEQDIVSGSGDSSEKYIRRIRVSVYDYYFATKNDEKSKKQEGEEKEEHKDKKDKEEDDDRNSDDNNNNSSSSSSSNCSGSPSSPGNNHEFPPSTRVGKYWRANLVATILPPCTLDQLYEITEDRVFSDARHRRREAERAAYGVSSQAPKAETAAAIIQRTLIKLKDERRDSQAAKAALER